MSEREKAKSGGKYHYETNFDYTLPRPPALGEERETCFSSEWVTSQPMDRTRHHHKSSSPILATAEYEDSCRPSSRHGKPHAASPPACLSWAHSLHNLLQDPDGVKLFLKYLESEGAQYADALHFWFACEGLKNHNEIEKIQKLVKLIYKTYVMKSALPVSDELRREITKNLKSPQCLDPPVTLFDRAQVQVESLINATTYPNFLKSDMYLHYLQSIQNPTSSSEDLSGESSSSSSSISNKELATWTTGVGPLPTLHEGLEFEVNTAQPLVTTPGTGSLSTGYHTPIVAGTVRLTKNTLLRSQNYRALDIRPRSETYAGLFMSRSSGPHAAYSSYNPVSRQDSEMQSLSSHSDARTESDNLSIAESVIENRGTGRSRHKAASLEAEHIRKLAAPNKDPDIRQTMIPRTLRIDASKCMQVDLQEHAAVLREKLENLKRCQETQEMLNRKLNESESMCSLEDKTRGDLQSRELKNSIRDKLQFQDDNDQDILDEHVSRVFSDPLLPMLPGTISPGALSPPRNRWGQTAYMRSTRKDKDVFSTFSGDSGNVHDFVEGSEHKSMVKSKSIPEYSEGRFSRATSCRRSSSKKTLTDLTDSGVSVVSETASVGLVAGNKESRVIHWLMASDKGKNVGGAHTHSEMALGVGKKYKKGYGSRSSSLERNSVTGSLGPAQPFVADPSMPPLPLPNTESQLEEARRRLLEDDVRTKSRQRTSSKYYLDSPQSSQSTLKKLTRVQRPLAADDLTTVVFSFCDEQFPYRTKIPGSQITLRKFKDYLPKKGNYRFFFKTVCEDLGNQVTHEEVSNDSEILPLWEGKIMAQVKPID